MTQATLELSIIHLLSLPCWGSAQFSMVNACLLVPGCRMAASNSVLSPLSLSSHVLSVKVCSFSLA